MVEQLRFVVIVEGAGLRASQRISPIFKYSGPLVEPYAHESHRRKDNVRDHQRAHSKILRYDAGGYRRDRRRRRTAFRQAGS